MSGAGSAGSAAADAAEARRRLGDALAALRRIIGSQRLDRINAERSQVVIGFAAVAVLGKVIDDGPLRMSDLATAGRIHPAALTRQVQALEAEGYIERSPDPTDGRAAVVRVTSAGRAAHRRVQSANDAIMAEQLSHWTADELVDLVDRLEHLITDLRTSPEARRDAAGHE
jgi:DNA-binding MarR family transcriptional regulator